MTRHHDPGTSLRTDGRDPVTASASAAAHGRIGLVAWALFEKAGGGCVITFDKRGRQFSIEVDGRAEEAGFGAFSAAMAAAAGRMTP